MGDVGNGALNPDIAALEVELVHHRAALSRVEWSRPALDARLVEFERLTRGRRRNRKEEMLDAFVVEVKPAAGGQ